MPSAARSPASLSAPLSAPLVLASVHVHVLASRNSLLQPPDTKIHRPIRKSCLLSATRASQGGQHDMHTDYVVFLRTMGWVIASRRHVEPSRRENLLQRSFLFIARNLIGRSRIMLRRIRRLALQAPTTLPQPLDGVICRTYTWLQWVRNVSLGRTKYTSQATNYTSYPLPGVHTVIQLRSGAGAFAPLSPTGCSTTNLC
ncbi:hypothetical protein EDB81DRAFT_408583 [Dactylonectria macrodidyma]|uniref:Uncharacterized protein n=1 Tax=Dactylonectria macrodidyma TaxID=307937 RepID=A0A9P9JGB9_9HYPO|nr:hypothetical protein EDB81DRAFT_408583 [Dactylonectria macrodidyma]